MTGLAVRNAFKTNQGAMSGRNTSCHCKAEFTSGTANGRMLKRK